VNLAHSVSVRLLELSRNRQEDHHFVLVRYGSERLLHRMASHPVLRTFVLKGATLFLVWEGAWFRATRDIDFLGFGSTELGDMEACFRQLCGQDTLAVDGLVFDPQSVKVGRIKEDQFYEGIRVNLVALLGRTRIPLQVDIGFGDAVTPEARRVDFPSLLGGDPVSLLAYPVETVLAEKFLAIATLGMLNSRMKDYYDLLVLGRRHALDPVLCGLAIRNTCLARRVAIPLERPPIGLTSEFWSDPAKNRQWKAFVNRNQLVLQVDDLQDVVREVARLLDPILVELEKADGRPRARDAGRQAQDPAGGAEEAWQAARSPA